jgi:beta-carotene ketolase (CrtO type)
LFSSSSSSSSSLSAGIEQYDAIVIGAGHNGLTCACYLAKAGLQVLVLEQYHSIGGMTITEEITLSGFRSDIHAYGYQLANFSPAPRELELDKYGFELVYPDPSISHLFPNGGIISMYRDVKKTVKSIEKYSKKDAQTWEKMFHNYLDKAKDKIVYSINNPPCTSPRTLSPQLLTRENGLSDRTSYHDEYRFNLQSLRSWCNENFESEEIKVFFGAWPAHVSSSPDDAGGGSLAYLFSVLVQDGGNNVVKGGMVNLPRALARYLQSKGGRIYTDAAVSKIIIKDRRAVGVRLDNGKEYAVRRLVVSSIDPYTLTFRLIGEEYFDTKVIQDIKRYEWGDAILTMYLALDNRMEYLAGPDALKSTHLHLSEASLDYFAKIFYECRSGKLPSEPFPIVSNDSTADPTRVPNGKHLMKFLISSVPYSVKIFDENENYIKIQDRIQGKNNNKNYDWNEIKHRYSDKIIDMVTEKYIPNLKTIIKKKVVYSPVDLETKPSTSVRGTLACGAMLPYQISSMRPIPQFAGYSLPDISNVYLCGSANHPGPGVSMAPGRNAAQVIFADLNLNFSDFVVT